MKNNNNLFSDDIREFIKICPHCSKHKSNYVIIFLSLSSSLLFNKLISFRPRRGTYKTASRCLDVTFSIQKTLSDTGVIIIAPFFDNYLFHL